LTKKERARLYKSGDREVSDYFDKEDEER